MNCHLSIKQMPSTRTSKSSNCSSLQRQVSPPPSKPLSARKRATSSVVDSIQTKKTKVDDETDEKPTKKDRKKYRKKKDKYVSPPPSSATNSLITFHTSRMTSSKWASKHAQAAVAGLPAHLQRYFFFLKKSTDEKNYRSKCMLDKNGISVAPPPCSCLAITSALPAPPSPPLPAHMPTLSRATSWHKHHWQTN